jgi:hypothetical protein
LSDLAGSEEDMAQKVFFFFRYVVQRSEVLFGNDKDVDRCLRIDVIERYDAIVLENELGRNFVVDNLAKQAIFHFSSLCSSWSNL